MTNKKKKGEITYDHFKEHILTKLPKSSDPKGQLETSVLGYLKQDYRAWKWVVLIAGFVFLSVTLLLIIAARILVLVTGMHTIKLNWWNIPVVLASWTTIGIVDLILIVLIALFYLVIFSRGNFAFLKYFMWIVPGVFVVISIIDAFLHIFWFIVQWWPVSDCETIFKDPITKETITCGDSETIPLIFYQVILFFKFVFLVGYNVVVVFYLVYSTFMYRSKGGYASLEQKKNSEASKQLFKNESVRSEIYQLSIELNHIEEKPGKDYEMEENLGEIKQNVSLLYNES